MSRCRRLVRLGRPGHLGHLARRFVGSLSRRPPDPADEAWAESNLLPGEVALWRRMGHPDRRHSIEVARRFVTLIASGVAAGQEPRRQAVAATLLHDVGKVESGLGTGMRVVATLVGPRGARLRRYHGHEQIGLALAATAGSEAATLELLGGEGPYAAALRAADDV